MSKTIAALFETPGEADYALEGLEQAGFTPYQISMLVNEASYTAPVMANADGDKAARARSLVETVIGDKAEPQQIRLCEKSLSSGNVFIAVHAFTPAQEITAWNLMNDAHAHRVLTFNG
jgi:hypothetical protein